MTMRVKAILRALGAIKLIVYKTCNILNLCIKRFSNVSNLLIILMISIVFLP